jgi:TatD DNase family protein
MLIDTHCHLDAPEFAQDRDAVVERAAALQVNRIIVPAVEVAGFTAVMDLAQRHQQICYALGIHPMFTHTVQPLGLEHAIAALDRAVRDSMNDPSFVGIGEIGLDGFVKSLDPVLQKAVFEAQLKLARDYELPVILHVRKAVDQVGAALRKFGIRSGIAHAFNGSFQQAHALLDQGLVLGFGGAMTFTRALQLRRLASQLPLDALVLETDAPDIAPAWVAPGRNAPEHVVGIGQALAALRDREFTEISIATANNAHRVLPRLQHAL